MEEVRTFLDKRLDEIEETKSIVSLFRDTTDFMADTLVDTVVAETEVSEDSEFSHVSSQLSKVVAELITEVPERVKSKTYEEDTMYSQFMGMTQQLMFAKNAADNVQSLLSLANKNMSTKVGEAKTMTSELRGKMTSFLNEFRTAVENNPNPAPFDTLAVSSSLLSEVKNAKQKTVSLQSRVLSGLDFSKFRIDELMGILQTAKGVIPNTQLMSVFNYDTKGLLDSVNVLTSSLTKVNIMKDQLMSFKDNMKTQVKPGDIFANNFSQLYDMFTSLENELSLVPKLDTSSALTTFANMKAKLDSISGMVSLLGTKRFVADLEDTEKQAVQQMDAFVETLKEIPNPLDSMGEVEYTAKAMVRTAERFITGTFKQEALPVLDQLEYRMNTGFDIMEDALDTFETISNVFDPPQTTDVIAYMSAIGTVAPAAMDALLTGSINAFQKTMESPAMLTKAGQAIAEMKSFAKDNAAKMSVVDKNMFGVVSSYLAGEHKRAMMSLWIGNTAAKRSKALTALDLTVNKFVRPIEKLVNILGSKFNV